PCRSPPDYALLSEGVFLPASRSVKSPRDSRRHDRRSVRLTVGLGSDGYNPTILTGPSLMTTTNPALRDWVNASATLTQPDRIHWCTGSDAERDELVRLMVGTGDLIEL